jgi:hypothetical protein
MYFYFADFEIGFISLSFQIRTNLSADAILGGNIYWLIKTFVSFRSSSWHITILSSVNFEKLKYCIYIYFYVYLYN